MMPSDDTPGLPGVHIVPSSVPGFSRFEDTARWALILLHTILAAWGAWWLLEGLPATPFKLTVVCLGLICQPLAYFLPRKYLSERRHQRLLIFLGVTVTATWTFPLSLEAAPPVWGGIVVVLVAPVAWQRVPVWIASTALSVALVFTSRHLGWVGPGAEWEKELLLIQAYLVLWVVSGFVFDSLRELAGVQRRLTYEQIETTVMRGIGLGLLAARNVNDVFDCVSQTLDHLLGPGSCLMIRVDPQQNVATLAAASGGGGAEPGDLDLGPGSPLRACIDGGGTLLIEASPQAQGDRLAMIYADTGFGTSFVISRPMPSHRVNSELTALLENIAEAAKTSIANVQLLGKTQVQAQTDALTGLPNRGSFQSNFEREFKRAERHERPLSLLMIDLDLLKSINDRHGHLAGDQVIRTAAQKIHAASRGTDYLAARYGGEEFAVILPETDMEGALIAAQRICDSIAETDLPTVGSFTASIGAACFPVNATGPEDLVQAADEALYRAKRSGRNQVSASATHTLIQTELSSL